MARNEQQHEGFALAAVLGFLMLVAAILTPFAVSSRVRGLTATNTFEEQRLSLAADAVNARLAAYFSETAGQINILASVDSCQIGGIHVVISVKEQHALVDLNYASSPLLLAGLAALGLDASHAKPVADSIRAFRSASGVADATTMGEAMPADGYKRGPFEDVVELQEIPALQRFSLTELQGVFTVYSKSGQVAKPTIDRALASALRAQGISPLENSGSNKPIMRFTTSLRTSAGIGNSDAIFELNGQSTRRVASSKLGATTPDEDPGGGCREAFWPIVRDLISKGLGA